VDHSSQLLKGVLDMCLLALIAEEPSYGYEMVDKLERRGLELVSEGSIYPTLSRLQKAGFIEGYFVETGGSGPPRKYYRIAASGRKQLARWVEEWDRLSAGVKTVLNGGERD
jgi:PadR family transcriptional regulator PadR